MNCKTTLAAGLLLAALLPAWPLRAAAREQADLDRAEANISGFDINAAGNSFKLLGDFDGTTIIFRISDAAGATRGALKLPSVYSNYRGEIAAYRLARFLGIGIFPATVPKQLDEKTAARLAEMLRGRAYQTSRADHHRRAIERKERNRRAAVEGLLDGGAREGCFKEWVENIQFVSEIGTRENLGGHKVMAYLKAGGPQPPRCAAELRQCSSMLDQKGCYTAFVPWRRLARDISDMMLIDALTGNLDRFPGGNVHVRLAEGKKLRRGGRVVFPDAELLALDNGATFMGRSGHNTDDLLGRRHPELRVERFAPGRLERLLELRALLREKPEQARRRFLLPAVKSAAGLETDMLAQLAENLDIVISHLESLRAAHGTGSLLAD
jgi:hypothetical protein